MCKNFGALVIFTFVHSEICDKLYFVSIMARKGVMQAESYWNTGVTPPTTHSHSNLASLEIK